MKILITKEEIIKGLQKAASLTSQKTGTTFLKAVWLKWGNNRLSIMATDSKMEFIGSYEAQTSGNCLVGINGRSFYELVKKLPPGEITLKYSLEETEEERKEILLLEQGPKKYKILTYDSSWFRDFVPFPENNFIKWHGDEFKELINRLYYFTSDDLDSITRYMTLRRHYEEDDTIAAFAILTQSFALKTFKHDELYEILDEEGYLIDKTFLSELKKWLNSNEIYIAIQNNRFFIKDLENNENISFPLVKKKSIDYQEYLEPFNKETINRLIVNKNELKEALERIYIFASDMDEIVKFIFNENELVIYCESHDKGEATESLIVDYQGDIDEVVFMVKSLRDIIDHFHSENIEFQFVDKEKPCKIVGLDDLDKGYLIITVTIKVKEEYYYEDEIEENYNGEYDEYK